MSTSFMYQKYNSVLKKKHQSFILPISEEENTFDKTCIEAAKNGNMSALFTSQLKPIKSIQNIRDTHNDGNSLLHIACVHKQLHLIEAFLSTPHLFDVNIQNNIGNTPLHLAIAKDASYIPIIECLIKHYSASVYIRNKNGETPQFLLSFSQFELQRIPELNILLAMHTFRHKKESEIMNSNSNESSLRTTVKSKISKLTPQQMLVYKQIYRTFANGSVWLRKEHLCSLFAQLNMKLTDAALKQILNKIDINNDGHVDFEDFLAFLLMPINDWTKTVLSRDNRNKKPEKVKQFKDSIYYNPLLKCEIISMANELKEPIQINKEHYSKLNEQFGEIFSCKPDEIDFVLKHIIRFANKECETDDEDDELTESEEIKQDYLDENIWKKILNDKINVRHKIPKSKKKNA